MKKNKNNQIEDLARIIEKKYMQKDFKKRKKMKVSGTGVKKLQKIIANKLD